LGSPTTSAALAVVFFAGIQHLPFPVEKSEWRRETPKVLITEKGTGRC